MELLIYHQDLKSGSHKIVCFGSIANKRKRFYGIQFHPEVAHTENGNKILNNFSRYISKAKPEWTMENFAKTSIAEIRSLVKDEKILCGG